jgi:hypothetical protein
MLKLDSVSPVYAPESIFIIPGCPHRMGLRVLVKRLFRHVIDQRPAGVGPFFQFLKNLIEF